MTRPTGAGASGGGATGTGGGGAGREPPHATIATTSIRTRRRYYEYLRPAARWIFMIPPDAVSLRPRRPLVTFLLVCALALGITAVVTVIDQAFTEEGCGGG